MVRLEVIGLTYFAQQSAFAISPVELFPTRNFAEGWVGKAAEPTRDGENCHAKITRRRHSCCPHPVLKDGLYQLKDGWQSFCCHVHMMRIASSAKEIQVQHAHCR